MDLITSEDLDAFIEKVGKSKANRILGVISKLNKDLTALMGNELAKEILDFDIQRMDTLNEKIIMDKASDQEFAEFRYLRDVRINMIVKKIQEYLKNLRMVKLARK